MKKFANTYQSPDSPYEPKLHATSHMEQLLSPERFQNCVNGLISGIDKSGIIPASFAVTGVSGCLIGGVLSQHYKKPLFVIHQNPTVTTRAGVQGLYGIKNYAFVDDIMFSGKTFNNVTAAMKAQFPQTELVAIYLYLEDLNYKKSHDYKGKKIPLFQTFTNIPTPGIDI